MEDRVADRPAAVARTERFPPASRCLVLRGVVAQAAVVDAVGETLSRRHGLRVEIGPAPAVVPGKPLMRVKVKDMRLLRPGVVVPEHDRIVQVGMVDVRRIVRISFEQRRIAVGPALEEEFLIEALHAISCGADSLAVREDHRAEAACPVVDRETVGDPGQLREPAELLEVAGVEGLELIVEEDGKLAERRFACWADDRVQVVVDEFVTLAPDPLQQVQHRHVLAAGRNGGLVVQRPAAVVRTGGIIGGLPRRIEGRAGRLAAVPLRGGSALRLRLDREAAEEAVGQGAAVSLTARWRGDGVHEIGPLALGMPVAVDMIRSGRELAEAEADVIDHPRRRIAERPQPVDDEGYPARPRPVGGLRAIDKPRGPVPGPAIAQGRHELAGATGIGEGEVLRSVLGTRAFGDRRADGRAPAAAGLAALPAEGLGIIRAAVSGVMPEQVSDPDMQDVADIGAQRQRPRPFAIPQAHFAGDEPLGPRTDAGIPVANLSELPRRRGGRLVRRHQITG